MFVYEYDTVLDIIAKVDYPHPNLVDNEELRKENIVQKRIEPKKFEPKVSNEETKWKQNNKRTSAEEELLKTINQKLNNLDVSKEHGKKGKVYDQANSHIKECCKLGVIDQLANKIFAHISINENTSVYVGLVSHSGQLVELLVERCANLASSRDDELASLSEHEESIFRKQIVNSARFISELVNAAHVSVDRCAQIISELVSKGGKYRVECACVVLTNLKDAQTPEIIAAAEKTLKTAYVSGRLELYMEDIIIKYELGRFLVGQLGTPGALGADLKRRCRRFITTTYIYRDHDEDTKRTRRAGAARISDMLESLRDVDRELFEELRGRAAEFLEKHHAAVHIAPGITRKLMMWSNE